MQTPYLVTPQGPGSSGALPGTSVHGIYAKWPTPDTGMHTNESCDSEARVSDGLHAEARVSRSRMVQRYTEISYTHLGRDTGNCAWGVWQEDAALAALAVHADVLQHMNAVHACCG